MKKGFTLLELMIVLIILGVLATLGVMQYQAAIEKARGAEARQIIGQLRSQCAGIYMNDPSATGQGTMACDDQNMGIGATLGIPGPAAAQCRVTNFFFYTMTPGAAVGDSDVIFTATRCIAGGKTPQGGVNGNLTLNTDYALGTDVWATTGGY